MLGYLPKYISDRSIAVYVALLLAIPVLFGHPMTWYWWAFGIVEVGAFFYFGNLLSKQWQAGSSKHFVQNVFWTALFLRIAYVLFSYYFYINVNQSFFPEGVKTGDEK